jgi:hypothetical protein
MADGGGIQHSNNRGWADPTDAPTTENMSKMDVYPPTLTNQGKAKIASSNAED